MNRALLELQVRATRGLILRRLRLLRQPRYLVGLMVGLAWIGLWAGRPLLRVLSRMRQQGGEIDLSQGAVRIGERTVEIGPGALLQRFPPEALDGVYLLAAAGLTTMACLWWLLPWHRTVLRLREEELSLLLAAPVSRRQLIQYALLRNQPGILLGTAILTLFMGSGGLARRALTFTTIWLLLTLWDLHSTARHLWHARTGERGLVPSLRRRLGLTIALGSYLLLIAGILYGAHQRGLGAVAPADAGRLQQLGHYLAAAGDSALSFILLAPASAVLAPFFLGQGIGGYLLALAAPLALLALHHEWVVRTPSLFEDAALEEARKRGKGRAADARPRRRRLLGRLQQPFALVPEGLPEMAIVWKNMMQVTRMPLKYLAGLGLAVAVLLAVIPAFFALAPRIYMILGVGGMALGLMQPMLCGVAQRHDLRVDLLHADILKCWPLSAPRLVAAELAAPVITASLLSAFFFSLAVAAELGTRLHHGLAGDGISTGLVPTQLWQLAGTSLPVALPVLALSLAPLVVALAAVSSAVQNLAALLFPGWVALGKQRRSGAAQFGQNLLVMALLALTMLLGLLPGLLLAGALLALHGFLGIPVPVWEWPLIGMLLALPLGAELLGLVVLTGRQWELFDPSAQNLAEA